ncbi:hypothetical protein [Flavobacterium sp. FlaQc-48]|uniref:hypothetical protein n=1 Tax=Flavobacterium sp. FlaQc-48 TaxID=3374181 RepID=UPI0037571AB7
MVELCVVTKSNNDYIFYELKFGTGPLFELKQTKTIDIKYKPALDNIFNNLKPKIGVKRYMSEYGIEINHYVLSTWYFSLFKNGAKTFEFWLPNYSYNNSTIEIPLDDEQIEFIIKCGINPDEL